MNRKTCKMFMIIRFLCLINLVRITNSIEQSYGTPSSTISNKRVVSLPLLSHESVKRRILKETDIEVDHFSSQSPSLESRLNRPHRREYTRTLQIENDGVPLAPLYQGYGTHYADLWVGTPPQRQTVIVDTGSGVTAFPCSSCQKCGSSYHTDNYFEESFSETFEILSCDFCSKGKCTNDDTCDIHMSYQEGSSWKAYEARDQTYVGGSHTDAMENINRFTLDFGCQTSLTGLFETQLADGIMGMTNSGSSLWHQASEGLNLEHKFALCFSRNPLANRSGSGAGALTLGGVDKKLHTSDMFYVKNYKSDGFYQVFIRKMYIHKGGGDRLFGDNADLDITDGNTIPLNVDLMTLNKGSVIVDSGTTDTYMVNGIATALNEAWHAAMGTAFTNKEVSATSEEIKSWPTFIFQLAGIDGQVLDLTSSLDPDHPEDVLIVMPPSHYMEYDSDTNKFIARISFSESSGSVLGANFIQGHDVLFDNENSRLGFAESYCDYDYLTTGVKSEVIDPYQSSDTSTASEPSIDFLGDSQLILITLIALVSFTVIFLLYKCYIRRHEIKYDVTLNIDDDLSLREFS